MSTSHPISSQADRDTLGLAATRFLITVLLGPLMGTVVVVIAILASEIPDSGSFRQFITRDFPGSTYFLGFNGFIVGVVPAICGGGLMAVFAWRFHHPPAQLLAAILLGALSAIVGLGGMLVAIMGFHALRLVEWQFYLVAALAGAVALLGSTLVFLRRVRPRLVA